MGILKVVPRQHPAVWIKGRGRHPATAATHGAVASCAMRKTAMAPASVEGIPAQRRTKGGQFVAGLPLHFRSRARGGLRSYMGGAGKAQRRTGPSEPFGPPVRRRDTLRNISQISRPGRHPAPLHRAGAGRSLSKKSCCEGAGRGGDNERRRPWHERRACLECWTPWNGRQSSSCGSTSRQKATSFAFQAGKTAL